MHCTAGLDTHTHTQLETHSILTRPSSPDVAGHAQGWRTPAADSSRGPDQGAHVCRATGAVLELQLEPAVLAG